MKTKLFITGLAIIAATAMVSAQQENGSGRSKCKSTTNGTAYVDKNNNGVCDNSEKTLKNVSMKKTKMEPANAMVPAKGKVIGKERVKTLQMPTKTGFVILTNPQLKSKY
ncbi:MAG: hypothetical protein HC830_01440 [Bacteroidetes bacterium]|nr:hypothetical protein [Bacteroidota bacterium]